MKKLLKSLWENNLITQLLPVWELLRRSLVLQLTLVFYFLSSLTIPFLLTMGLIISHILGIGMGFDWYVDGLRSYYYDGEIFGMTGIPSWRGHLLWLFLCWLFSIALQD